MAGKKRKRTAFVPTVVFGSAAVLGVLPLCVTACGGATTTSAGDTDGGATDAKADALPLTVAYIGFDANVGSNDSGSIQVGPTDAGTPADDGSTDAGSDSGPHIVPLAFMGFDVRYFKQGS
jgi:hypothetical protein